MYCFRTNISKYCALIILLHLKCHDTTIPTSNSQYQKTYYLHKKSSWLHQYFDQLRSNHNTVTAMNNYTKYIPKNITKQHLLTGFYTNISITDLKYIFEGNEYNKSNNSPSINIKNIDYSKAFALKVEPQYLHHPKENIFWKNVSATVTSTRGTDSQITIDEGKWWTEYYRTLHYKYPWYKTTVSSPTKKETKRFKDIHKSNQRIPTRKASMPTTETRRTSISPKDLVHNHKSQLKDETDNTFSSSDDGPSINIISDSANTFAPNTICKDVHKEIIQWSVVNATFPPTTTGKDRLWTENYRTWSHIYSKQTQSPKIPKNTVFKHNSIQRELKKITYEYLSYSQKRKGITSIHKKDQDENELWIYKNPKRIKRSKPEETTDNSLCSRVDS